MISRYITFVCTLYADIALPWTEIYSKIVGNPAVTWRQREFGNKGLVESSSALLHGSWTLTISIELELRSYQNNVSNSRRIPDLSSSVVKMSLPTQEPEYLNQISSVGYYLIEHTDSETVFKLRPP
jgi:hypothetical protein